MTNKELIENLKRFKKFSAGGRVDGDWTASNKEVLMSQIQPAVKETSQRDNLFYWQYFSRIFSQRIVRPALATLVIIAILFGYTAIVSSANASIAGDILYPIKTAGEKIQLALTFSQDEKIKLQMTFVNRRVDELRRIARQPGDNNQQKEDRIRLAINKISQDVKVVKEDLTKISFNSQPKLAVEVAREVDSHVQRLKEDISEVQKKLSKEVETKTASEVQEVISTTEETADSALEVIIAKYQKGEAEIPESEIIFRLAARIKKVEENIIGAEEVFARIASSTAAEVSSEFDDFQTKENSQAAGEEDSQAEELELSGAVGRLELSREAFNQAKDLLDRKDFQGVLEKVKQGKILAAEAAKKARALAKEAEVELEFQENVLVEEDSGTTTEQSFGTTTEDILDKSGNIESNSNDREATSTVFQKVEVLEEKNATSTEETSETTKKLLD